MAYKFTPGCTFSIDFISLDEDGGIGIDQFIQELEKVFDFEWFASKNKSIIKLKGAPK